QARLGSAATEASGELLTDGSGEEPAPGVCGSPPPTELIAHHRNRATTTIPATTKARRFQYTAAGWSPTGCVSPSMVTSLGHLHGNDARAGTMGTCPASRQMRRSSATYSPGTRALAGTCHGATEGLPRGVCWSRK